MKSRLIALLIISCSINIGTAKNKSEKEFEYDRLYIFCDHQRIASHSYNEIKKIKVNDDVIYVKDSNLPKYFPGCNINQGIAFDRIISYCDKTYKEKNQQLPCQKHEINYADPVLAGFKKGVINNVKGKYSFVFCISINRIIKRK